ncbi:IclR family transcriptional regulator [Rhodococcus sp. HNM0569]|uniref:IclR family transcriptional regulator n=1 Tax=Rhodococcus sp. HNM0569 TaxID=2716340 RepID=UPI00146D0C3B|nr:IclR family transcriptional regulator [Rhodococcus sp. HNM0569]NLU82521.1 IclR family transcriptional regulator [Rhodococcus sp. HNM0569]
MAAPPHCTVLGRAAALLRAIADGEQDGSTTTQLARETSLARPTVHRLLESMSEEGLVDRDHKSGRWLLGPELYLLGSLAAARYDITSLARPLLRDLSRRTGESAFLSRRRADETVCLASEEGSFPLRSHVLHVGIRLPLGVASAGLAILSHLPEREIDEYLGRVDLVDRWGPEHSRTGIEERIAATRDSGYCVNPALLVEGSWGMGAAVFNERDEPEWALSLTGVETRFAEHRRPELGRLLLEQSHLLTRAVRGHHR